MRTGAFITWTALTASWLVACGGGLSHRIDDRLMVAVPTGERSAVFAAQSQHAQATAEGERLARRMVDLATEIEMAEREKERADAELERQTLAEELAERAHQPDRVNAARRARQGAALAGRTAMAHQHFLQQERIAAESARTVATLRARAAEATTERAKAELVVRKRIDPGRGFRLEDFVAQEQSAAARVTDAKVDADREAARASALKAAWQQLVTECRAFPCP